VVMMVIMIGDHHDHYVVDQDPEDLKDPGKNSFSEISQ